jgi:glycosyltransferase involved in cell wall biosynthesis
MKSQKGISIILCGYNSSRLLPETLKHLAHLKLPEGYPVELVLVDNASTDETGKVAAELWQKYKTPFPIYIHHEEQPGLMFARKKGLQESKYAFILFVDDDNWPDENYLLEMVSVFMQYPNAAAIGGANEAVFETSEPEWFHRFEHSYAVGQPAKEFGEPDEIGLFGAGLCLRREAYDDLVNNGFRSRLVGRTGKDLSSGEDYELCKALKIAGWDILFSPQLKLKHFITTSRLNWEYLKKLNRGISQSIIWFLAYEYWIAKVKNPATKTPDIRFSWFYLLLKKMMKSFILKLKTAFGPGFQKEGSMAVFEMERTNILIRDLIKNRKAFILLKKEIGRAKWNKRNQQK